MVHRFAFDCARSATSSESVFYTNQAARNMSEALEEIDVTGLENDNEKLKEKFKEAVGSTRS